MHLSITTLPARRHFILFLVVGGNCRFAGNIPPEAWCAVWNHQTAGMVQCFELLAARRQHSIGILRRYYHATYFPG